VVFLELKKFFDRVSLRLLIDRFVTFVAKKNEIFVRINLRRLPATVAPGSAWILRDNMRDLAQQNERVCGAGLLNQGLPAIRRGADATGLDPENLLGSGVDGHEINCLVG
jgi:hypothetical protein